MNTRSISSKSLKIYFLWKSVISELGFSATLMYIPFTVPRLWLNLATIISSSFDISMSLHQIATWWMFCLNLTRFSFFKSLWYKEIDVSASYKTIKIKFKCIECLPTKISHGQAIARRICYQLFRIKRQRAANTSARQRTRNCRLCR